MILMLTPAFMRNKIDCIFIRYFCLTGSGHEHFSTKYILSNYSCFTKTADWVYSRLVKYGSVTQTELPRPIPWISVESDLGCTLRIYFDNVMLTLHNVTLTSQKPCQHNNRCDCSKTNRCILLKNT